MSGKGSGRRTPMRRRLHGLLMTVGVPVVVGILWVLRLTWRKRRIKPENGRERPVIFAYYHGDMFGITPEVHKFTPDVDVLVSRSRDGALVARFVEVLGCGTIRGGSSKGQIEVLREIMRSLKRGRVISIAVDGPRGPAGVVKPGVILAASRTGVRIIPGVALADRAWRTRSWDRTMIPKPFAKLALWYGDPIHVPPDADKEELEAARVRLEEALRVMHTKKPDEAGR